MRLLPSLDLGPQEGTLLVFGGPYSNLEATLALRDVADSLEIPPQRVICTGDLVAYGAEPDATVNLIREWGIHVVRGNCEEALASRAIDCGCGFETGSLCSALSEQWFRYADRLISDDNRAWMSSLPHLLTFQSGTRRLAVVHGGVERINQFFFASTPKTEKQADLALLEPSVDGLLTGHCGIPFGEMVAGQAWLNAGVIGLPANDGTQDGWYLLIDAVADQLQCRWHRLTYAADRARQAMLAAGLLGGYGDTLLSGLWPSEDVLPAKEKCARGKALAIAPLLF